MCRNPQRPEEDIGSLGAGITSGHEQPDLGVRNQVLTLSESSKHSHLQSHRLCPQMGTFKVGSYLEYRFLSRFPRLLQILVLFCCST